MLSRIFSKSSFVTSSELSKPPKEYPPKNAAIAIAATNPFIKFPLEFFLNPWDDVFSSLEFVFKPFSLFFGMFSSDNS